MASFVAECKHLEIQLEDIISATNNFDESKVIGRGGFGKVYAGEFCHSQSGEKSLVAIKRLDRRYGQGDPEFFKEIRTLSCYRHENLISLLGFCCQGGEMILIYEYASRGSLDRYLSSADLTWMQRLRICIDAAKGLSFLHDPNGTQQRVLHCDIKSANILLDKNMTAKVSDFGLSKMGPASQQYSLLITNPVGTPGYCDPLYMETYSLTKESDVYSFGVVLFEVLSGKPCVEYSKGQLKVNHVPTWKQSYEENKLNDIILQDLMQQMDPSSLKTFSDIAFQCLQKAREERPTMSRVVEELEIALESQEFPDLRLELLTKHEDILMAVDPLLLYKTGKQLKDLLSEAVLVNGGKTWVAINEKGEHIERIYIQACLNLDKDFKLQDPSYFNIVNSRFPGGHCYKSGEYSRMKARVRAEYLTPHISYTANLVFIFKDESDVNSYINPLRYEIDGEAKVFIIYPSTHMREDGWFIVPLYHFTTQHTTADLQFEFEYPYTNLLVAGIEFQPSEEKVQLPSFEEYQCIIKAASQSLFYRSLDELKQILSKGVLLNGYKTWFSLNEKGEHCHMISMEDCLIPYEGSTPLYESHVESRFPAGIYKTYKKGFETHVKTQLLSPSITYTVNLVCYSYSNYEQAYVDLKYRLRGETTTSVVYLANQRKHSLYMAELFQFTGDGSIVDLEIDFDDHGSYLQVEGILFQPLEKVEDQVSKDDKVENIQTISNSDSDSLIRTMKEKLYSIFRRRSRQQWLSVDKHGKKCLMLSAKATWVIDDKNSAFKSSHESRFGEVLVITVGDKFELVNEIKPEVLSADTTYASYFVYKLPSDQSKFEFCSKKNFFFECPLEVRNKRGGIYYKYSYLVSPPNTPVIGQKFDENRYNPLNRHKISALPRQRSDGWMEVRVWEFQTQKTPKTVSMNLLFKHPAKKDLCGLIIHGIELRPI